MSITFGERISGLTVNSKKLHAAVFNENEVRAAAGLTLVIGAIAFGTSSTSTCRSRSLRRSSSLSSPFEAGSEGEILEQVAEHARDSHGMDEVPPEVVDTIRASISER